MCGKHVTEPEALSHPPVVLQVSLRWSRLLCVSNGDEDGDGDDRLMLDAPVSLVSRPVFHTQEPAEFP